VGKFTAFHAAQAARGCSFSRIVSQNAGRSSGLREITGFPYLDLGIHPVSTGVLQVAPETGPGGHGAPPRTTPASISGQGRGKWPRSASPRASPLSGIPALSACLRARNRNSRSGNYHSRVLLRASRSIASCRQRHRDGLAGQAVDQTEHPGVRLGNARADRQNLQLAGLWLIEVLNAEWRMHVAQILQAHGQLAQPLQYVLRQVRRILVTGDA